MNLLSLKIDNLFKELGYTRVIINGKELYCHGDSYYKFTYINDLKAYVIEYANNYDDAMNNVFEDGDIYPIDLGEFELIKKMRSDLINYY